MFSPLFIYLFIYLFILERVEVTEGGGGETLIWERHIHRLPPAHAPTRAGHQACHRGLCPCPESHSVHESLLCPRSHTGYSGKGWLLGHMGQKWSRCARIPVVSWQSGPRRPPVATGVLIPL
uniref:Secreted protein n=1 Tax=Myotis myotis TaxID=51298 RepID=A0A7J7SRR0_MYOMY|nr:hypothetical protein mMyoMyo1_009433 [Myotis myotis]